MKKSIFIIAALVTSQMSYAQQDTVFFPVHEIGVSAGTGLSTLLYKSVGEDGAVKAGAGGVFSFDYAYNFNYNWAIVTGVSFLYSQQRAESKSISQNYEQTYEFEPNVFTTIILNSTLKNWTEKQEALFLQIPVMARYQSALKGKIQYYVALGGKIGFNVLNSYKAHADMLVTEGVFDEFRQVFTNIPNHNFMTINDMEYSGKGANFIPNFSIAFEAGVKQTITSSTRLYVGLFCEYGLSNLNGGDRYAVSGLENNLVSYQPDNSHVFNYAGLLQSGTMKNNSVNLLSAGLKLRFTFNLKNRKTMFGSKIVYYKSEKYSSSGSIK
jgi:hypothetical protein